MKQTKITFNLDGLAALRKGLGATYRARVGVLGSDAARTDGGPMNNAEIGVIQMFGSVTNNIPPRDFLTLPVTVRRKELQKAMSAPAVKAAVKKGDYKRVYALLGIKAEEIVQEGFDTGGFGQWPPNAPATIDRKGSAKPLIDTAQLRRAISSDVVKAGKA